MAAASKKATEAKPAEEVIEKPVAVRQPVHLADRHGRLNAKDAEKARADAGIAPQTRLIEHTAAGVLKGS